MREWKRGMSEWRAHRRRDGFRSKFGGRASESLSKKPTGLRNRRKRSGNRPRLHRVCPKIQRVWAQGVSQWVARREIERANLYLRRKFGLLKGHSSDEWKEGIGEWRDQALLAKSWKWMRSSRPKSSRRKFKAKVVAKIGRLVKKKTFDDQTTKNPLVSNHASHILGHQKTRPIKQLKSNADDPKIHRSASLRPPKAQKVQPSLAQASPSRSARNLFPDENQAGEKKRALRSWMRRGALASVVVGLLCLSIYALLNDRGRPGQPSELDSKEKKTLLPNSANSEAGIFGSSHRVKGARDLEMIWVKPGTFMMGSPPNEKGRGKNEKLHKVTLSRGFYLGKYEVTQAQYFAVTGSNPSNFSSTREKPLETLNWIGAENFCKKLMKLEQDSGRLPANWHFALPTEAEWEYACRAGTNTVYSWGNSIEKSNANYGKSEGSTSPVGTYSPNPWGFHDMHGNVMEWTADWMHPYPEHPVIDPKSPSSGSRRLKNFEGEGEFRIARGGGWSNIPQLTRAAKRFHPGHATEHLKSNYIGFRLALKRID